MKTIFLIVSIIPCLLFGQIFEDFSDGELEHKPSWSGDLEKFIVTSQQQLRLQDTDAGSAYLSVSFHPENACEWKFYIRQSFSGSDNNFGRVYLWSSTPDPAEADEAIYLQMGEGGSNDTPELWHKKDDSQTSILRAADGLISNSFSANFKVLKKIDHNWQLWWDAGTPGNLVLLGEAQFAQNWLSGYFALYAQYTVSNRDKFYWDNILLGEYIPDTDPPGLQTHWVDDNLRLKLVFTEPMDAASMMEPAHYRILSTDQMPSAIEILSPNQVLLDFYPELPADQTISLWLSGLKDVSGNELLNLTYDLFIPDQIASYDLVINEIMADPSPQVGLPPIEFIEFFNTVSFERHLLNWYLYLDDKAIELPDIRVKGNEYMLIGDIQDVTDLELMGPSTGVESFGLTNGGQQIRLVNSLGEKIHEVSYRLSWYGDDDKAEGGYTLEQIDPDNPCAGASNWTASVSPIGGSPAQINSVYQNNPVAPKLRYVEVFTPDIIKLYFDQFMDPHSLKVEYFDIRPDIGNPQAVYYYESPETFVELYLTSPILPHKMYTCLLSAQIQNCKGISIGLEQLSVFGIPEPAINDDLIINEILFHPYQNEAPYIELFNASDKILDMSQLRLLRIRESFPDPTDTLSYTMVPHMQLLAPDAYWLISPDTHSITSHYAHCEPRVMHQMEEFPLLLQQAGELLIEGHDHGIIDHIKYHEDMHHPLLEYTDGVALERLSPFVSGMQTDNWHSAPQHLGFGTPGLPNSFQVVEPPMVEILLQPNVFSPDMDGYDDLLLISGSLDQPDVLISIDVYSELGLIANRICESESVGESFQYSWDGRNQQGNMSPAGVYLAVVETLHPDGKVTYHKIPFVLATKAR